MLKPKFTLTKKVVLPITRRTASTYVDGDVVLGTTTMVNIEANVQPLKDAELLLLPEADRSREWVKVYTADVIRSQREGPSGYAADTFIWLGDVYKVIKVKTYSMGLLDHTRAMCARVELTPN